MNVNQTYELPPNGIHQEWSRNEREDFVPTARQAIVIAAVKSALDAGLYYTEDVYAHCVKVLKPTAEQLALNLRHVERGEFGMDCYYARDYLRAQEKFAKECEAMNKLQPHVGQDLGTLVFNDFKRTTGMRVEEVMHGGRLLKITGKRGSYKVGLETSPLNIGIAMDRAKSHKHRRDDFSAFCAKIPNTAAQTQEAEAFALVG